MIVEVTQEHINRGVAGDLRSSPIALAMLENNLEGAVVTDSRIRYETRPYPSDFHESEWMLAPPIKKWILDFDQGKQVTPIKIEIGEYKFYATLVE